MMEPTQGASSPGDAPRPEPTEARPPQPPPGAAESGPAPAGDRPPGRRRRGSRGGRRRSGRPAGSASSPPDAPADGPKGLAGAADQPVAAPGPPPEEPRRPRIGDTRPAPAPPARPAAEADEGSGGRRRRRRRRGGRGRSAGQAASPVVAASGEPVDPEVLERRRGAERKGRPVGRYLMCVHVRPNATQIAVLEGRTLVEHYVSRVSDDATQIDGNIYRGRVQNVLPGMEAAFVDISTPKNAVLYRGDVRYDRDDIESPAGASPRIEQMLRPGQTILCQVTKNPIGAKGARLTQEVSLPGRFVVMVPNSTAFGISKRLDENERRRLRRIVDDLRPAGHGLIVRTAAEGASHDELRLDVQRLVAQWDAIEAEAGRSNAPGLLYREPDLAVRIVREEFNREYRGVVIDDPDLFAQVREYVAAVNPELVA